MCGIHPGFLAVLFPGFSVLRVGNCGISRIEDSALDTCYLVLCDTREQAYLIFATRKLPPPLTLSRGAMTATPIAAHTPDPVKVFPMMMATTLDMVSFTA